MGFVQSIAPSEGATQYVYQSSRGSSYRGFKAALP